MKQGRFAMINLVAALIALVGAGWSPLPAAQAKSSAKSSSTKAKPKTTPKKKTAARRVVRSRRTRGQTVPTRDRIVEIQDALARDGFYSGTPSGKWDANTTEAMSHFQTANGLTATGKLGALSLQKLGLGSDIAGKAAPLPLVDAQPSVLKESQLDNNPPDTNDQSDTKDQ
jgi:peptidoglycan hydrolase-like protein with peptidoglycan-binding domain